MDLHILAATAHHLEAQTKSNWGSDTTAADAIACKSRTEQLQLMDFEQAESAGRSARSSDSLQHKGCGQGVQKHSKHRQAEAKRRERINDRLQALRQLVPHDTRQNTATFLEGVISYIQSLQHSNAQLEAQLSTLRAVRTAGNLEQHQELLAQPAGSGSSHQPVLQQHQQAQLQYYGSSWRQDSNTGPQPHTPEAAAAASAVAAAEQHWQNTGSMQMDPAVEAAQLMQALQQHAELSALQASGCPAFSSPTPLPHASAAAAAAGPSSSTLSAPASLMQGLMQATSDQAAAGRAASVGGCAATPANTAATEADAAVDPAAAAALQPGELQGVLEKALLAALQHQAQHMATQLLSRGS